jgi:hypothetical protein
MWPCITFLHSFTKVDNFFLIYSMRAETDIRKQQLTFLKVIFLSERTLKNIQNIFKVCTAVNSWSSGLRNLRNVGILPQHCAVSQFRPPRLEASLQWKHQNLAFVQNLKWNFKPLKADSRVHIWKLVEILRIHWIWFYQCNRPIH